MIKIIDIETTGFNFKKDEILKIGAEDLEGNYEIIEDISKLEGCRLVGHNIKFDLNFINEKYNTNFVPFLDTMIMTYLAFPEMNSYGLKNVACKILGVKNWSEETFGLLNKEGKKAKTLAEVLFHKTPQVLEAMLIYLKHDVNYTTRLFKKVGGLLDADELQLAIFLTEMDFLISNKYGEFEIDQVKCKELIQSYTYDLSCIEAELYKKYELVNPSSPKQLSEVLFKKLNFKPIELTKTGAPSTSSASIKKMAELNNHEIFDKLIEFRKKKKMLSSFLKPWSEKPNFKPRFSLTGTVSGRTSCSSPNIQQVPRGDIRKLFKAPKGYDFVEIDYSQMELRIAGVVAGVSKIIEAFEQDKDLHTETHINLFGKPDFDKNSRGIAKVCNFGLLYGMSAGGFQKFADQSGIKLTNKEAEEIRNAFFKAYPELIEYYVKCRRELASTGQLKSLFGRIYKVDKNMFLSNHEYRSRKERSGINALVQGYSSDLLLVGLKKILTSSYVENKEVIVVGTVHDSVLMYIRKGNDAAIDFCKKALEHENIGVPIKCDVDNCGDTWK